MLHPVFKNLLQKSDNRFKRTFDDSPLNEYSPLFKKNWQIFFLFLVGMGHFFSPPHYRYIVKTF